MVSILIPVYNRENLVRATIESAIKQTYRNIEIIAVDNKSTDKTFEVLKEYAEKCPNVKIYQNNENLGPVKNWQKCLEYANGEYVKILWSDDLIHESFIEKTLPILIADSNVGFVFTGTEIFNDITHSRIKSSYFIKNTDKYDSKRFIEGSLLGKPCPVSPGNAIFRKMDVMNNLVIEIPNNLGIDFKMHGMGNDLLLFLLTAIKYSKFSFVNENLSFFRAHKDSITISGDAYKTSIRYTMAKAYFVENYIKGTILEKKFNSILLMNYIFNLLKKNVAMKPKYFYMKCGLFKISYTFLIVKLMSSGNLKIKEYIRCKIHTN